MRGYILPTAFLAALSLAAFYAGAESATSNRLKKERTPPAILHDASPHLAASNCLKCHKPHFLDEHHSPAKCADCHISDEKLRPIGAICSACHDEDRDEAPKLSVFRGASYRYQLRKPDEMLQPVCSDCHDEIKFNRAISPLVHPIRAVGSHIDCARCHSITAAKPGPAEQWDYPSGLCGECHKDVVRGFVLNEPHSLAGRKVRCQQCHPPHERFKANLTVDNLALMGNYALSGYDPVTSNELCLRCHNYIDLVGGWTRFALPGGISLHQTHLEKNYASCVECHNPHKDASRGMIRDMTLVGEPFLHFALETGGSCAVNCHGQLHRSTSYLPQN